MKNKRCLLITGTVIPNSNYVSHTNTHERLKEYHKALVHYASEFSSDTIYFLENSAYDFTSDELFSQLFLEEKIILLKFKVSDKYNEGKGFQEFEMLDKAIEQLKDKHQSFIKITGRYIIKNLKQITNLEINGLMIERHKKLKVAHTNVFYSTFDFYTNYVKGLYKNANDSKGIIIEHLLYDKINTLNKSLEISLFSHNPQIIGISGSYGISISRNQLKMKIRNVERKLLRLLGINEFLVEY